MHRCSHGSFVRVPTNPCCGSYSCHPPLTCIPHAHYIYAYMPCGPLRERVLDSHLGGARLCQGLKEGVELHPLLRLLVQEELS